MEEQPSIEHETTVKNSYIIDNTGLEYNFSPYKHVSPVRQSEGLYRAIIHNLGLFGRLHSPYSPRMGVWASSAHQGGVRFTKPGAPGQLYFTILSITVSMDVHD